MLNKKLMILTIFFVSLFVVSAVSAADNATNDVVSVEETSDEVLCVADDDDVNEVVSVEDNDHIIGSDNGGIYNLSANSDGTFTDLANDIANANGEFKLTKNYVYDSTKDSNYKNGIVIDKEITINGRGFIINGNNKASAFNVTSGNVILKNIEFTDCTSYSYNYRNGVSDSQNYGGAVYWSGANGILFSCNFVNCYSSSSTFGYGSASSSSYGGAVYWDGINGSLFDCSFVDCYSKTNSSCTFSGTTSSSYGGAVYWNSRGGNVFDCNFINCYSVSSSSATTTEESRCNSYSNGGALYWNSEEGSLFNCSFVDCYSKSISDTKYGSASSSSSGGAVFWKGINGNVFNCKFSNSKSISTSKAYYSTSTNANTYSKSYSYCYGGAVYWGGANGSLLKCDFINSTATSSSTSTSIYLGGSNNYNYRSSRSESKSFGGAVYLAGSNSDICDCNLINSSISSSSRSTSLRNNPDSAVYNNYNYGSCYSESKSFGGAVYLAGSNSDICDCNFINCFSSSSSSVYFGDNCYKYAYGDAIYIGAADSGLFNCSFINCKSNSGYTIFWDGNEGNMFNCSFDGNYYDYETYCVSNSAVYPVILIHISTFNNDDCIVIFESTQLVNNISVILYDVTDRKILYDEFDISSEDLTSSLNLNNLPEGEYQIVLEYAGDNFYTSTSTNDLFMIGKNSTYDVTINERLTEGDNATINLTLNEDATGQVKITLGDYTIINELIDGKTSFNIPNMSGGINTYQIKYIGDDKYNPLYIINTFNVLYRSSIVLDLNDGIFDEAIPLTYTITPNCTGIISIYADNVFKANISVGEMFVLENLSADQHNVKVIYNGNEDYANCSDEVIVSVSKANPSINVNSSNFAGDVLFEISLNEKATGNITITINNNPYTGRIKDGKAKIIIPNLVADSYASIIDYSGDSNYNPLTQNYNFSLQLKKSNMGINVNDITFGEVADVQFNLTADATGIISIFLNNSFVKDVAIGETITIPDLTVGNYLVKLIYSGDEYFESCDNTTTFNVLRIKPTIDIISVSSTSENIIFGDIVNVNYDLTNGVTGNIGVYIDDVLNKTINVGDSLSLEGLNAGYHTVKLVYNGDENYQSCEDNATFEVLKKKIDISNAVTIIEMIYGKTKISFVSSFDGILNINASNKYFKSFNVYANINNYLNISDMDAGDYEIEYVFIPNNQNYDNATTTGTLTIFKSEPAFDIIINDINYKESANLDITYLNDVTGFANITISNDEGFEIKFSDVALNGDKFNQILSNLNASEYMVTLEYGGNNNYYPTTQYKTFNVFKIDPVMVVDVTNAVYGQNARIVVNCNAKGNITIAIGSVKTYDNLIITDNRVLQNINDIDAGTYDVKIKYNGNNNYNVKTVDAELTITKLSSNVVATVEDIIYSQPVVINVKGSIDGVATVKIDNIYINNTNVVANVVTPVTFDNIPVGTHNVSIILTPSNKNYNESVFSTDFAVSKKQTSIILDVEDSVYGDDVIVNVTASEDGNVVITVGDITKERNVFANTLTRINFGIFAADSYAVSAEFNAGNNYRTSTDERNIIVLPAEAKITDIQTSDNVYGQNTIIKVKTNVDGTLTIQTEYNQIVDIVANKLTSIDLGILDAGLQNIKVTLNAGSNYTKPTRNATLTVSPKPTTTSVNVDEYTYGENVIVNVSTSENGKITVKVGTIIKDVNVEANRLYSVDFGILNANSYNVNVTFNAGNNYQESYNNTSLIVSPAQSEITEIQIQDNSYGENTVIKVKTNVDGVLTATINTISKNVNVNKNQLIEIDFGILDADNYEVQIIFDAGNNYILNNVTKSFNVFKIDPEISIDVVNATYGQTAKIIVNCDAEGNVTIAIGTVKTYESIPITNMIIQDVEDIDAGNYTVKVTYNGNTNYNIKTFDAKLTINKASSNVVATVDDITYSQTAIVNVKGSIDGFVTIKIDNNYINNTNIVANTVMPITFDNIPTGAHNVSVTLTPSSKNYDESTFNTDFSVSKKATSVDLGVKDSVYGEDVIVNVTASADGKVILTVGDITREKNVLANTLTKINLGVLAADTYDVEVTFDAGENYKPSNNNGNIVISPAKAEILTIQGQNNIYGENTIIKVKTNVGGSLTFKSGSIVKSFDIVANKLTSFDLGLLDAKTYDIEVSLNAGNNYTKPVNTTQITIAPKQTTVNINVKDSTYGDNVIVNVSASENGKITVKVGTIVQDVDVEANKVYSVDFGILDAKSYAVNATFNGGNNYEESYDDDSLVISPAQSKITEIQALNSVYGENVTVNVKTNVDGFITAKIGDITEVVDVIANQIMSVNFGVLDVNSYDITLNLNAGGNYVSDNNSTRISVSPKQTYLTLNVKEYESTENVIVNVTASENGKVTIKCGSIVKTVDVIANNVAPVNLGVLPIGPYEVIANFTAGNNYINSSDSAMFKVLSKINDDDISISVPDIKAGQANNIAIKLPGDATGTINLTIGNDTYTFGVTNGVANVKVPELDEGNYNFTITYSGDNKYSSFSKTNSISVTKIIPTTLTSSSVTTVYNGGKYLVATLKDSNGKAISGVEVTVVLNGKTYTPTTDANGQVKLSTNSLAPKSYVTTITFNGNNNYAKSTTTIKVTVTKATPKLTAKAKTFKKSVKTKKYTVTLKDNNGKAMAKVKLTLKVKGKTYKATTNAKGKAIFKIKKLTKKGTFKAKVKFAGNTYYNAVTKTVKIKIK